MPTFHPSVSARAAAGALVALLLAGLALILTPLSAHADSSQFSLTATATVGETSRDAVVDDARGRVYVTVDPSSGPGQITWYDIATGAPSGSSITLPQSDPTDIALSADGNRLYVIFNTSQTLAIVDLTSPTFETRERSGTPSYPSGLVEDTDTGVVYVFDSTALTRVDPSTGAVSAPIAISTERYPLIKDAVYDATNHMVWIAEGRAKVITGYSTITGAWVDSLAFPVSALVVDGTPVGGRAAALAMDETLGELHIAVNPTISDSWDRTKVVSLRVADGRFVGTPVEVGENVYEMAVNPATHEVVTTDGFTNTVSVIRPDTWTAETAVDFTTAGVTQGTGSPYADTWGLGISADGSRIFASHPYSDRLSEISRAGDAPVVTEREVTPGQEAGPEEPTVNEPWEGPAAPTASATPAGASATTDGALTWAINTYMQAWGPRALGDAVKSGTDYGFSNGIGWVDRASGAADLVWDGGIFIQHYPALAPEVTTILGNPRLQIDADGTGSLSFDVSWKVSGALQSDGYRRVTLATFSNASVTSEGDAYAFTAQPDFFGRALTLESRTYPNSYPADFVQWLDPQLQPWWLTTGASMDAEKPPLPFAFAATLAAAAPVGDADGGATSESGADRAGADANASADGASGSAGAGSATADATSASGAANGSDSNASGSGSSGAAGSSAEAAQPAAATASGLATTGGAPLTPWFIGGAAMIALGGLAFGARRLQRARAHVSTQD